MIPITIPLREFTQPYLRYASILDHPSKPTPAQAKLLQKMDTDRWYEPDDREVDMLRTLVVKGWCEVALLARRNAEGRLEPIPPVQLLLDDVLGIPIQQPRALYRKSR